MKRGDGLQRRATLARSAPKLGRGVQQRRTARTTPPDDAGAAKKARTGDWSPEVRALVLARSKGQCETCAAPATDLHHRQARRTRQHTASNALAACRQCHRDHHANPRNSREAGWIVSTYSRPESTPVLIHGEWVFLTDDGRYTDDYEATS